METNQVPKDLSSYIGKLLRENFGRGPESVFVSIKQPIITVYLRKFLSPLERVLINENQETVVHTSRDILMKSLIPEIKAYITVLTGQEIEEFYYDWSLHNQSGMFVAITNNDSAFEQLSKMSFTGKESLNEEITYIGHQAEKVPEEVFSVKINDRTFAVFRTGLLVTIERELIRLNHKEILMIAKRRVEKRLLHNNMRLESILDAKIDDSFVSWDFDRDRSVILFIVDPNQKGGSGLDK